MSYQEWFNILTALVGALGAWWMKTIWDELRENRKANKENGDRMQKIEVLIAGEYAKKSEIEALSRELFKKLGKLEEIEVLVASHYVTKDEFSKSVDALLNKLDRIDEKLDRKADK